MSESDSWFLQELEARGVSRRDFVGFCSAMAAVLALPRSAAAAIAAEIQKTEKPVLVWLEFQDCAGNTESFLRASRPTAAEIVLDTLSVDYHETIMAAAGHQAEEALAKTVKEQRRALHRRGRGLDPDRRERGLLHDRGALRPPDRARGVRRRRGHDRHGHLRHLRRPARGGAEPHRRPRAWATRCRASRT